MSATPPVPQPDDFDAAVDAYVDGAAPAPVQDAPVAVAEPPKAEAAQPATAPTTTPTQDDDDSDDEALALDARFARAQRRETRLAAEREAARQEAELEKRRALSYQGNLAQEQKRRQDLIAERDEFKRLRDEEAGRIDKLWTDAIKQAPDEASRTELERQYAIEKRERTLTQKEQAQQFTEQQAKQQQEQFRQASEQDARRYATSELPAIIDQAASGDKLPPTLFQPVKDYVDSPVMRRLAATLPLATATALPGDPAGWDFERIDSLHLLRTYLERQAELGYEHFKQQHENSQVKANAQAATQTYQPEKPVGAGVGRQTRAWEDMDADEAVDAWFETNRR